MHIFFIMTQKELLEYWSITLEIFAFFLVTIDLYGRERIDKFKTSVLEITRTNLETKFKNINILFKRYWIFYIIGIIICLPLILFLGLLCLAGVNTLLMDILEDGSPWHIVIYIILLVISVILSVFIYKYSTKIFSFIIFYFFFGIVKILQGLSKVFPIEGMMVVSGTILFLVSKTLAYIKV